MLLLFPDMSSIFFFQLFCTKFHNISWIQDLAAANWSCSVNSVKMIEVMLISLVPHYVLYILEISCFRKKNSIAGDYWGQILEIENSTIFKFNDENCN